MTYLQQFYINYFTFFDDFLQFYVIFLHFYIIFSTILYKLLYF
mgnify:FL=1